MILPITYPASNPLLGQLATSSKFILSSTDKDDTAVGITIVGLNAGGSALTSETITLAGKKEVLTGTFSSIVHASVASGTLEGTVLIRQAQGGVSAQGSVIFSSIPADGQTVVFTLGNVTDGITTHTYTFKDTPTSPKDVLREATTTADNVRNLYYAIIADPIYPSKYGAGTVYNPDFSATYSGSALTFYDSVTCSRQLVWTITTAISGVSLVQPLGGTSSTLIASLSPTLTTACNSFALSNEAINITNADAVTNLKQVPPYFTFRSKWIPLFGNSASLYLSVAPVTGTMTASYETSTDTTQAAVRPGQSTIASPGGVFQVVPLAEQNIEYFRLVLVTAGAATPASVNAKLVAPSRFATAT